MMSVNIETETETNTNKNLLMITSTDQIYKKYINEWSHNNNDNNINDVIMCRYLETKSSEEIKTSGFIQQQQPLKVRKLHKRTFLHTPIKHINHANKGKHVIVYNNIIIILMRIHTETYWTTRGSHACAIRTAPLTSDKQTNAHARCAPLAWFNNGKLNCW